MSYAPQANVQCPPALDLLRSTPTGPAQSLHPNETAYIAAREKLTVDAWKSWLGDGSNIGYKLSDFNDHFPRVGIAISGGGYRAAQFGAGALSALDARNQTAKDAGTGGLLQASSYISGVSGGSWLLSSIIFHEFPTLHDLVLGNDKLPGWLLDIDLLIPGGANIFNTENQWIYGAVLDQVYKKADAGFDTSITDPWARLLGYHFLPGTTRDNFFTNDSVHGAGILWSDIPSKVQSFSSYQLPLPLVVADSRPAKSGYNGTTTPLNWVVYEFSPFEFGSWDPDVSAFTDVAVTGTHLNAGEPDNSTACVQGFDQASFVIGTSSSLFNSILYAGNTALKRFDLASGRALADVLRRLTSRVQTNADDVANWPNSFLGHKVRDFIDGARLKLELIDGGSNQESIPIGPLLVDARNVDTIVVLDGTDDDSNAWPTGVSIYATRNRTRNFLDSTHQPMPPLPDNFPDFVNFGLNRRPTFFGCDPTDSTASAKPDWPLLIYLPNMPPVDGSDPITNSDTFTLKYSTKYTGLFLDAAQKNTMSGFVPNQLGADPNFPKCLQCAAIDRSRYKQNATISRSAFCTTCFKQYCFDRTNPPSAKQIVGRKLALKSPDSKFALLRKPTVFGPIIVGAGIVLIGAIIAAVLYYRRRKAKRTAAYRQVHDLDADAPWKTRGPSFEMPRMYPPGGQY